MEKSGPKAKKGVSMEGVITKPRTSYNRETRTAQTKTFLWDNPELRKAFREANEKERQKNRK